MREAVRASAPATSANLGPGFDALGLALELREEVALRRLPAGASSTAQSSTNGGVGVRSRSDPPDPQIRLHGVHVGRLRPDRNVLAYRAAVAVYGRLGRAVPPLALDLYGHIPRSGGLGGSAAAIVAGMVAANALEGEPLDKQALLELANQMEGHPDNVAPALLGGLVVCVQGSERLIVKRLEPPRELRAVVYLPDHAISTKHARSVLPNQVSRHDAVFNLSRTALLVAAFQTRDWPLLREAMNDQLHQPARANLLPALFPTIKAAVEAGAHGAALSGSGAAILALATERLEEVAAAMQEAAHAHGTSGRAAVYRLASDGATVRYPASDHYVRHSRPGPGEATEAASAR